MVKKVNRKVSGVSSNNYIKCLMNSYLAKLEYCDALHNVLYDHKIMGRTTKS